jgi:hypothetical protein
MLMSIRIRNTNLAENMKNTEDIKKFAAAGILGLDLVTGGNSCKSKRSKSK